MPTRFNVTINVGYEKIVMKDLDSVDILNFLPFFYKMKRTEFRKDKSVEMTISVYQCELVKMIDGNEIKDCL